MKSGSIAVLVSTLCATFAAAKADPPNVNLLPADLVVPETDEGEPAAGRRVFAVTPGWEGTGVRHVIWLPPAWRPGTTLPVIVEYPGNGGYRNDLGDVSEGTPEGCSLGYGLSAGEGCIWVCLPLVEVSPDGGKRVCREWWGDVEESKRYCVATVGDVCRRLGGDPAKVVLCGFSRGAIACNFIGLHDDTIASLWCGFFCHSHYDGVRVWPYAGSDRDAAVARLRRLGRRPQWISHELDVFPTREFIEGSGVEGDFEFVALPYPNHSPAWILRGIPQRARARDWLRRTVGGAEPEER